MNLFGTKKQEPKVNPLDAISNLQRNADDIDKRIAFLETKVKNFVAKALSLSQNNDKTGIILCNYYFSFLNNIHFKLS